MAKSAPQTTISLRGTLCRDLLELVASGVNAAEAATQLLSDLLNSTDSGFSVQRVDGIFLIERRDNVARNDPPPTLFQ